MKTKEAQATILVRDVPRDLYSKFKAQAALEQKTVRAKLIEVLEGSTEAFREK